MKRGRNLLFIGCALAGVLLARFLLPLILPLLVGLLVACMAEPLTRFLTDRWRFPRAAATAAAIGGVYAVLLLSLWGLGSLALRELDSLPQAVQTLESAAEQLHAWILGMIARIPARFRAGLEARVQELFSGSSELTQGAVSGILGTVSRVILHLPDTFIFLGTAVLSSFMISVRLPGALPFLEQKLPRAWSARVLSVLQCLRENVGRWLAAQCKLVGITFLILTAGFFVLRIAHPVWLAALVALVDALPVLGTGTVLIPWGIVTLLLGEKALGLGLLALYGVSSLTRSILEPRLISRHLGLHPLLTLGTIYVGYRLWGLAGMILAPVMTITMQQLWLALQPGRTSAP